MASLILRSTFVALVLQLQASHALFAGHSARASQHPHLNHHFTENFIVVPEHKLLFCYIQKVACSNFNSLFRAVRSRYDASQFLGHKWRKNSPQAFNLSLGDLEGILANRSWHKAVFYREPVERFVSAYASKCEHVDKDGALHCKRQFGTAGISFGDAVQQIKDSDHNGTNQSTFDEHFRLQSSFCGGLRRNIRYYDTVEELDRSTSYAKVSALLATVGIEPSSVPELDKLFPKPDGYTWMRNAHNTAANGDLSRYFPAGEEWRDSALRHHYAKDYKTFYHRNSMGSFRELPVYTRAGGPTLNHWPLQ